jgi:hypothetical protein
VWLLWLPLVLLLLLLAPQEVIKKLKPGETLMFWQEPSNPADPGAVHVKTMDGKSVGYVAQDLKDAFPLPVRAPAAAAAVVVC